MNIMMILIMMILIIIIQVAAVTCRGPQGLTGHRLGPLGGLRTWVQRGFNMSPLDQAVVGVPS